MIPSVRASIGLIALLGAGASGQQTEPKFTASTTAVIVDVVVRDKQKHPVAGLTADDFTVLEDGKRQEITSFAAVGATPTAPSSQPRKASAGPAGDARQKDDPPFVTALVFEQLGTTGRSLALHGATRLLDENI